MLLNAGHRNVVSVFLNQGKQLYTTGSWGFMVLEDDGVIVPGSIWEKARFGEDVIIGNLDTDDLKYLEVCETDLQDLVPIRGVRSNGDRRALHVIRYEYRLSEVLHIVRIKERELGEVDRIRSNLNRELIRGILKEFCYLMKVAPNDSLYLQHPENCMIIGYDDYMAGGIHTVNPLISPLDEFSTEIQVKFGCCNRSGGNQTKLSDKLRSLKILLSKIVIKEGDVEKKGVDVEWTDFLNSLTEENYKDAHKHSYLMHWDTKLDFVDYLHNQLNLNGGRVIDKARQIFNNVKCLDKNWKESLESCAPIQRIWKAKVTVHHDDDEEEGEVDHSEGIESGQGSKAGGIPLEGQGSSSLGRLGVLAKGKGKQRILTQTEELGRSRRKNGANFVKVIRNSNEHVTQVKRRDGDIGYEYVNIKQDDSEIDKKLVSRRYLYRKVKQALPEFWIETVPAARSQGFMKREEAKDAIFYSYTRHINGFAAMLDDEKAAQIARHRNVVSVFLNQGKKLYTTGSWGFMGLKDDGVIVPGSIWEEARFGEDAIIGNLDTGVWPESMSFSDEGLGPVPSKRKGICQNDVDSGFHCNSSEFDRILTYISYHEGSWLEQDILTKGMLLQLDLLIRPKTLRDAGGQGSRTLSTAGGSFVPRASVFYFGNETAKGGSPKSRVAPYEGESLSVEGLPTKKFYPIIRSKDAKAADAYEEDAELCKAESLDSEKVKGKILVCLRGDTARVDKGQQALSAGAVAMILANNDLSGNEIIADPHVLPASHITYSDGLAVYQYIKSTKSPVAYLTRPTTQLGTKPAPFMAAFSSTGPNLVTPEILKPDITAPGVSIIAAYTREQGPTNQKFDKRRVLFNAVSGTSMSCPHVSGIAGLLKTLHPKWSPSAIKSAMMTTARTQDNKLRAMTNASHLKASPFSYGAGHVQPNRAMDPGLVYDLTVDDYLTFLCSLNYNQSQITLFSEEPYSCPEKVILTDFNYPSITVPNLKGSITVTRTVKNVGSPGTYKARIVRPPGITVSVEPDSMNFNKIGEEKSFKVTLKLKQRSAAKEYVFGKLIWSDGKHYVRSPIVVKAI
ncbi:hypothetical protein AgCh_003167 [Apium graveolens]